MATTPTTPALPAGTWSVEPADSSLKFRSRGMFGLVPVNGTFARFDGSLRVDATDITGELRIEATSLDTGNGRRDTHLRSKDFFDTENHPTVTFRLTSITPKADGAHEVAGELRIRENVLAVTAPLTIQPDGDRLTLSTELAVDRAAAGLGWSKLGMIKGPAQLTAVVTVTR